MPSNIQALINEKYPHVVLESPIQGWVYLEEFDEGITQYESLKHPTAQDDRWAGVCYFHKVEDMRAIELYYRAIARGEQSARINLAHAYHFIERGAEVMSELMQVNFEQLNPYDKVFFLRVKSIHIENNGDLIEALRIAEEAWRYVQGITEFPLIAPAVLNQLGVLHGRIGRAPRALWYLDRSLEMTDGRSQKRVLIKRAYVLNTLGRYTEALQELNEIDDNTFPAEKLMYLADATWATRNINQAIELYEQAVLTGITKQLSYEEFYARLALVAILGQRNNLAQAGEHLARAKMLISDKSDELNYKFREALYLCWKGELSTEETITLLKELLNDFGTMGLLQEHGWVRLHLAEMYRRSNNDDYINELNELQTLSATLQNKAFLAREWTLLPELRELALKSHPDIAGKAPTVLEVYSMGEPKLVLGGQIVTIRLTKGIEVLTYFLEHDNVSLKKLLLDIFADEKPKSAKAYFHQFRKELQERIPGLSVLYNPEERTYSLKSDIDILWDVAELRAGRKMGSLGIFLESSGSEWVEQLEFELSALKDEDSALGALL